MTKAKTVAGYTMVVDLERCEVSDEQGFRMPFRVHVDHEIHEFRRHCILNGLDEIGLTLAHEAAIQAYEERVWGSER